MLNYWKNLIKIITVMRYIFGAVLLIAFLVKLFGAQETFASGYFDNGVLDAAFKAFLMVEVAYWSLRFRIATTPKTR